MDFELHHREVSLGVSVGSDLGAFGVTLFKGEKENILTYSYPS